MFHILLCFVCKAVLSAGVWAVWCLGKGCFACVACSGPSCVTHEGIPSGLLRRACVFSSGNHHQRGGPPVCKVTSEAARLHSHPGPRMAQECLLCDAIHPASTALDCAHPGGLCLPWAVHGQRALFLRGHKSQLHALYSTQFHWQMKGAIHAVSDVTRFNAHNRRALHTAAFPTLTTHGRPYKTSYRRR